MRPIPADKSWDFSSSENQNRWNDNWWSTPEKRASWLYERREQMSKLSFPRYSQPLCKGSFKCTGYRLLSKAVVLFFSLFFLLSFFSFLSFFLFFFFLCEARLVHTKLNNTALKPIVDIQHFSHSGTEQTIRYLGNHGLDYKLMISHPSGGL